MKSYKSTLKQTKTIKLIEMMDKEEIIDIIDCIIRFDDTESLNKKGRFFEIIQKDLRKVFKDNQKRILIEMMREDENDGFYD